AFAINAANTLTVSETGKGTITSLPGGINCPTACSANFAPGTAVTLTATPASGWTFKAWGGACSGTGTCTVTMNTSQNVSATFSTTNKPPVSAVGGPAGGVASSPAGIDCGATCSASFNSGTPVTLTASPASGWSFQGWGGACSGTGTCSLTMTTNQNVSAAFVPITYALGVSVAGGSGGKVTS